MKKLIFSFLFIVIAGFASQTIPVYAAESPPAEAVLGAEETRILTQALNILETVFQDMKVLLVSISEPIPNSVELNLSLEAIKGNLTAINSTIEREALAYAERVGETKAATLPQGVLHSPTPIKETPSLFSNKESPPTEETAALTAGVGQGNKTILWVGVVLLALALGLALWEWLRKKEPKVAPAPVKETQTPVVPMVREDNIQGIPPDY